MICIAITTEAKSDRNGNSVITCRSDGKTTRGRQVHGMTRAEAHVQYAKDWMVDAGVMAGMTQYTANGRHDNEMIHMFVKPKQ